MQPLLRLLLPGAGRHRAAVVSPLVSSGAPRPAARRGAVVFVHGCHSLPPRIRCSALFVPYPRAEFERWQRVERRLRCRDLRGAVHVGEVA
ncbi:hypothetical protein AB0P17_30770 [Streptomyces sp. NPDC088124]|uniref:hypothetical protein n=1 Tax=Streptomyces sp. NPDC088124 TaxID=3154654 RepID=UPI0034320AA7